MRIGSIEVKRRVWIGLAFALSATGLWWMWIRTQRQQIEALAPAKQPFVRLAGTGASAGDQLLREQAELLDPTPLFFPTEWNFGQRPLRESVLRQPGEVFGSFPPNLEFGRQGIKKSYGAESAIAPERLSDVLAQGNETPFAGMGQIDVQRTVLAERSGYLEVTSLLDGKAVMGKSFNGLLLPRTDFAPIEYMVAVSSLGIVGDPILMVGPEGEEVDEKVDTFFRSYLVKTFHLGERLSPGRYRVLVGP